MVDNQNVRASDADRDRVASALREHCAVGRLTVEEVGERLDRTYAARTLGELAAVSADLPPLDAHPLPVSRSGATPVRRPGPGAPAARSGAPLRRQVLSWASTSITVTVIWLIILITSGGDNQGFWPIWVIGPWGAALLARAVTSRFD